MSFHEIRFPTTISRGATGGPERRTDVVALGSGHEERNSRWADSRRSYNAGYGVKTLDDLHAVIAFFEERRGRLYGFRWKDHADFRSGSPSATPTALDQHLGIGDGATSAFQLVRKYGADYAPWSRRITKPVPGTVLVAVDGTPTEVGTDVIVDATTGLLTFHPGHIPAEAPSSLPVSSSMSPSASTPTSSRSISRASATAPFPRSRSWKSAYETSP